MSGLNILMYGDSPVVRSGFGRVMRNLAYYFKKAGHNVYILGINHPLKAYDIEEYPYIIEPAVMNSQKDIFGRQKLIDILEGKDNSILSGITFNCLFTLHDINVLGFLYLTLAQHKKEFQKLHPGLKWMWYVPVDSHFPKGIDKEPPWEKIIDSCDYPVFFTKYGIKEYGKKAEYAYHGCETDIFYPEEKGNDFRKSYFQGRVGSNDYLIINVSRNGKRKNIPDTIRVFSVLKKSIPNAKLYLHMPKKEDDNLVSLVNHIDPSLELMKDWFYANGLHSFEESDMRSLYNAADVLLTTTHGEGWGLPITEAMACKLPVVGPKCTSLTEILDEDRGWLVDIDPSRKICYGMDDLYRTRPSLSISHALKQLLDVRHNKKDREIVVENAYDWVQDLTWEKTAEPFVKYVKENL